MFDAIKARLQRCETWMQPHEDITWLVARVTELTGICRGLESDAQEHYDVIESVEMELTEANKRTAWWKNQHNMCEDRSNEDKYT